MEYYFAYGSNMNQEDLSRWCRDNHREVVDLGEGRAATLVDYRLVFNHYSTGRRGGAANIESENGGAVRGVLYEVTEDDLKTLRDKEGYPGVYGEEKVKVKDDSNTVYEDVITYKLVPGMEQPRQVKPTRAYLDAMKEGARVYGLGEKWLKKLDSIPCAPVGREPHYF